MAVNSIEKSASQKSLAITLFRRFPGGRLLRIV